MAKKAPKKFLAKAESTQHEQIIVDTDFPRFLDDLEQLTDQELDAVQTTVNKIEQMTWNDVYRTSSKTPGNKRGLNWEPLDQETAKAASHRQYSCHRKVPSQGLP